MDSAFSEQVLADNLSKLNNSQQCIETLSHWCIFHRNEAELIIQIWEKQFHSASKEDRIPLLYLANDILQNSKRNGTEFVEEFWKVLPSALKEVIDSSDERGKNVVSRLVGIWHDRKVFRSCTKSIKDVLLGDDPQPVLELTRKRTRSSIRIVRRDSKSLKIKLHVGGRAEKVLSAFHTVLNEQAEEDAELGKCRASIRRVEKMAKDVDDTCIRSSHTERETLTTELIDEEAALQRCVDKLKVGEVNRAALVSQLKEALQEQESELEKVHTQLQLAEALIEEAANLRRRLNNEPVVPVTKPRPSQVATKPHVNGQANTGQRKKSAAAIAAEVADKLAASTDSQKILTIALSTIAAEEAKNANSDSRPKIEEPVKVATTAVLAPYQPQQMLMQQVSAPTQITPRQPNYALFPGATQQYGQPPGGVMISVPYAMNNITPPPPPPHVMNMVKPVPVTPPVPMSLMQPPMPMQVPVTPQPVAINFQQQMHANGHYIQMNPQQIQFAVQQPAPPSFTPLPPPPPPPLPPMGFYPHQR